MLDFLGYLSTVSMGSMIIAAAYWIQAARRTQVGLMIGMSLWFGLAVAAAAAGWLAATGNAPPMGAFVAGPLIAGAVAAMTADGRRALMSLPLRVILALNIGRVLGFCFVILGWQGRLGGPFPVSAGWGDLITGLGAVALLLYGPERTRGLTFAWNLFGIADLVAAIFLGVTSSVGSPQELFHFPPGSAAMQHLPWSIIPSVLVPYWLVMHAVAWAQLRDAKEWRKPLQTTNAGSPR